MVENDLPRPMPTIYRVGNACSIPNLSPQYKTTISDLLIIYIIYIINNICLARWAALTVCIVGIWWEGRSRWANNIKPIGVQIIAN